MKKILIIVLIFINFLFFQLLTQVRDDKFFFQLSLNNNQTITSTLDIPYENNKEKSEIIDVLSVYALESNAAFKIQVAYMDRTTFSYVVYGSFFNNLEVNQTKEGLLVDFTNKNETKYLSTEAYTDKAIKIPHFNVLPIVNSDSGIYSRWGYTLEPISYLSELDDQGVLSVQIVKGELSGFKETLTSKSFRISDSYDTEVNKQGLNDNYNRLYIVSSVVIFIGFILVYNHSVTKRLFVNKIQGISYLERYSKIFVIPLMLIILLSFIPLITIIRIKFSSYPLLIKDTYKILLFMIFTEILIGFFSVVFVIIENLYIAKKKSIALWSSAFLRTALLIIVIPILLLNFQSFGKGMKSLLDLKSLTKIHQDSFTLSNEMFGNYFEIVPAEHEDIILLRNELKELGAITFDSNTHQSVVKSQIRDFEKSMHYVDDYGVDFLPLSQQYDQYIEKRNPIYWNTIYVNDNYVIENNIVTELNTKVNTVIVPSELMENINENLKKFPACQLIECTVVEKNLKIKNISMFTYGDVKEFRNPILFIGADMLPPLVINPPVDSGSFLTSNVAGVFMRNTFISTEHIKTVTELLKGVGNSYTIDLNVFLDYTSRSVLQSALDNMVTFILLLILVSSLCLQAIVNYQSLLGKEIAVRITQGMSYTESTLELQVSSVTSYVAVFILLLTRRIPAFLQMKDIDLREVANKSIFALVFLLFIFEVIIQVIYKRKFMKGLVNTMKGDRHA